MRRQLLHKRFARATVAGPLWVKDPPRYSCSISINQKKHACVYGGGVRGLEVLRRLLEAGLGRRDARRGAVEPRRGGLSQGYRHE